MTKKLIIANWKMHKNHIEAREFVNCIHSTKFNNHIVICPPFTLLNSMQENKNFSLGAQNCSHLNDKNGAFTGDISASMLKELNCEYAILGHSERRKYHQEDNSQIKQKIINICSYNIAPILCIGESLKEREDGTYLRELEKSLESTIPDQVNLKNLIIAYEPLWSIGTGIIPSNDQIEEVHNFLSKFMITRFAKTVKIIYGGSVNLNNASSIARINNVDGLLIGAASLDPETFKQIALTTEG